MRKAEVSKLSDDVKAIKRANTRFKALAKKYGVNSQVYKNVVSPWLSEEYKTGDTKKPSTKERYEGLVNFGKDGIPQISTKFFKEYQGRDVFLIRHAIENAPTIKSVESNAFASLDIPYEEWKKLKPNERTKLVKEEAEVSNNLEKAIGELYKAYGNESVDVVPRLKEQKGFTDVEEAKKIIKDIKKALKKNTSKEFESRRKKDPRNPRTGRI